MAFRAAMTGHQVYSTLHTNSAVGAIPRLLDIGIVPDIMAGNIIGIIAQRLVRRLCRTAGSPTTPTRAERAPARAWRRREPADAVPRGRLRAVRLPGLQGPPGDHGAAQDRRRRSTSWSRAAPPARETRRRPPRAKGFRTLADDGVRLVRGRRRRASRRSCAWSTSPTAWPDAARPALDAALHLQGGRRARQERHRAASRR